MKARKLKMGSPQSA